MKKIIFDLDNTLLFISKEWFLNYQEFIDKFNLDVTPIELYKTIDTFQRCTIGKIVNKDVFMEILNEKLPLGLTLEKLDELLDYYASIPLLYTDKIYDVLSYLSNKYELIVYSNWFKDNQIKRLKNYDLDKFFTEIYGWDILPVKPSKEGLEEIVKDKNKEDYIFVGDSIDFDLKLPNEMGMDTIFLNRKNIKQDTYKEIYSIEELKDIL